MTIKQRSGPMASLLSIAISLGAAGSATQAQTAPPFVVKNDRGGLIGARAVEIRAINARNIRVELRGRICYSSCTLYLGAEHVCLDENTVFGFHGPSQSGRALSPERFEHWSAIMADHYNPPLRDWFLTEARHRISGYYRISGASLIAMGYAAC